MEMPKIIEDLLNIVKGKKTTIMSIVALFVTLSLTKGWIDNNWAIFLNGTLVVLGFSANYGAYKIVQKEELRGHKQ